MSFVHLHVHSQYSLLEAACGIKKLTKKAADMNMPALALTDNGNMFGAVEFYFACKDVNIKPIIGLDVYIAPKSRFVKGEDREAIQMPNRRLVLLAKNYSGYQNLCQISTKGYQEGFYYKPRIDYDVLKEFKKDLIVLSGGLRGEVAYHFLDKGEDAALQKIRELKDLYGENFYLEMCKTGLPEWDKINPFYLEASKITGVPLVATNDVHYISREDSMAQEVLICIGTNKTLQDESRFKLGSDQFYLKSPDEMRRLFADNPAACDATLAIADQVDIKFQLKDEKGRQIYHLPTYPTANGTSLTDEIKRLSYEGLELRFQEATQRGESVKEEKKPEYFQRLDYELSVIDRMGFNGYFLIVQDFIGWAKQNDIPVGPGRGSGAGSLVAYSLRITDLDPLKYSLIFERFLNPERISMPDFDIDFCQDRRQEVIHYVTQKYGAPSVSQIITFGKLQARAAIRDVGRVLGMTFQEVDVVAKLIPERLNITLEDAIKEEPRLTELGENEPRIAMLLDLARKIEGLTRHASIHAAGVVIADGQLVQHAPLYRGANDENVVQYDMKNAEKIGLIKFDFLGLKTLTLIHDALKMIESNRGKKISTAEISMSDPGIYEIMSRGDTAGIFQFEGDGISDLIKRVRPTCFEDITAINALYRPGPMQMLDEYIGRKHGKIKVSYIFEPLAEVLKETYGIIVYQEQVQLIAAKIASYSLGEADMLRRAMGKKIPAEMAQQRTRFMDGARQNGFDENKASELFDLMAKFAEYGFNKSHAAAYCVVAAQTAWLKNYYPAEFFAAMLSTELSDTDKVVWYSKDARKHGLKVNAPHVNFSYFKFTAKGDEIFFGLGAIKGVGESAVEAILEARQSGPFTSLPDFFERVDLRRVNKKVIECLIKSGALDGFRYHRAQMLDGYSRLVDRAEEKRKEQEIGQGSLFDLDTAETETVEMPDVPIWSKMQLLNFEKEVLGFYLSDHPLSGLDGVMQAYRSHEIVQLGDAVKKQKVIVAGLITTRKEMITRKGTRMAFGQLEDLSGTLELVVFPDAFAKNELRFKDDGVVFIEGLVERADDSENATTKLIVEKIEPLRDKIKTAKRVVFHLDDSIKMDSLKMLMEKYAGETPVSFQIKIPELKKTVDFTVEEPKGLTVSPEFLESLQVSVGRSDLIELH